MDDSYLISQINKHTERISGIEVSIKYLQESIDKLSCSIDKLAQKVDNRKGFVAFIKENWHRIPTMFLIFYGIIWFGNYFNDNFMPEKTKYVNSN